MQPDIYDVKDFTKKTLNKPKKNIIGRPGYCSEPNCRYKGRSIGRMFQTNCNNCGRMICLDCRGGLRSQPYTCSFCRQSQQSFSTANVDKVFDKIRLAADEDSNSKRTSMIDDILNDIMLDDLT